MVFVTASGRPEWKARLESNSPAMMSLIMSIGSSLRGLSSVITILSAYSSAAAPIRGRLPLSRSPPQPNTHHNCPLQCKRAAAKAFLRHQEYAHNQQQLSVYSVH